MRADESSYPRAGILIEKLDDFAEARPGFSNTKNGLRD
jgi:hypothetical protein